MAKKIVQGVTSGCEAQRNPLTDAEAKTPTQSSDD
jgi:hypothetical protein